jgi:uncharacterized phage infection (PIP) family protein YhgE
VTALHEKLERTKNLMKENEAAKGSFQDSFAAGIGRLLAGLTDYGATHAAGCRQLADRVGSSLEEGVAGLGQLTNMVEQLREASKTALTQLEHSVQDQQAQDNRYCRCHVSQ